MWVNGWGGREEGGEDISLVIQSLSHKLGRSFLVDVENMMFYFYLQECWFVLNMFEQGPAVRCENSLCVRCIGMAVKRESESLRPLKSATHR